MFSNILKLTLLLLVSFHAKSEITNYERINEIEQLTTFTFGSCNSTSSSQPIWKYMLKDEPQLFIWGGDNIYADTSDPSLMQQMYQIQNNKVGYKELRETTPIIGVWDDHDYGHDNATYSNSIKYISQQLFLDFIREPSKSLRRNQEGIYTSYTFGPKHREIKFIMLDNRFHHSSPEKNSDILGNEQWSWFEKEIKNSNAKIHFIVAGLSILSRKIPVTEEWEDHPRALKRMLALLDQHNPSGVVFLTGDKHFSSIFQRYGYLEFMNSGMTHTVSRVLRRLVSRYYPISFFGMNYGKVNIEWNEFDKPLIQLEIKGLREKAYFIRQYELTAKKQWERIN